MRKGEEKRLAILDQAEELFLTRGYEGTSVQDILDAMHASKGCFYHYFVGKEELLHQLTARRAERAAAWTDAELSAAADDMGRINAVLRGFTPLRTEEIAYLRMLTPHLRRSEGRGIATLYQDALVKHFLPLLQREIARAQQTGTVCPPIRGMEEDVLHLVNHCWMDVATLGNVEAGILLTRLERTRRAIEVLLDAPYGSVEILRVEEVTRLAEMLR